MEWRSLEDFPNFQFSDTGLIKKNGKYLAPYLQRGYHMVTLSNGFIRNKLGSIELLQNCLSDPAQKVNW